VVKIEIQRTKKVKKVELFYTNEEPQKNHKKIESTKIRKTKIIEKK